MQKSIKLFLIAAAGFLALLWLFSEALRSNLLTPFVFIRPFMIAYGLAFFLAWIARIIYQAGILPPTIVNHSREFYKAIRRVTIKFFFSSKIGFSIAGMIFVLLAIFSVWYASLGLFPEFPKVGNLYVDQAEAFLNGHLSLNETPSPQILALPDPYSFQERTGLPYLWDASLYQGKYYLYWGPVPALLLAGIMGLTGSTVPDPLLVIVATIGISAVLFVLLWKIRKRFFPQTSPISISLFLVATILNMPSLFLLGRGRVYETSIITGQLFLFAGVTAYFFYFQSKKHGWLFLAGLSWGLAIACRYNLAVSVAIYMVFVIWMIWTSSNQWRRFLSEVIRLVFPLAICMVGLAAFNWMRFGSPIETGLNYQLTAPVYQNQHFSAAYFRTNIYLNLQYPYRKVDEFPFIRSLAVDPEHAPDWVNYNPGKRAEETTFSLRLVPLIWNLPFLLITMGVIGWAKRGKNSLFQGYERKTLLMFSWMIGLAGLAQFIMLQFYYYSAVRFMADYYLSGLFVGVILIWSLDHRLAQHFWLRILLWTAVIMAILSTAILGFLAGFDNPPRVFEVYHPALETQIAAVWNTIYFSQSISGKVLRYLLSFIS